GPYGRCAASDSARGRLSPLQAGRSRSPPVQATLAATIALCRWPQPQLVAPLQVARPWPTAYRGPGRG
ncbi:hypothetical protein B296_00021253, partial [Ensete ventricosum]